MPARYPIVDDAATETICYSRGRNLHDANPVQHVAGGFAGLIAALRADRAPVKDGAAYICGPMAGKRSGGSALPTRFLAVDADHVDPEIWPEWREWWHPYRAVAWPTHSSRPEARRERVIVELERAATREEARATGERLCRALEARFGAAVKLDRSTLRPEQPIHVPPVGVELAEYFGDPLPVEVAAQAEDLHKSTQDLHKRTQDDISHSCVGARFPPSTHPAGPGSRNRALFELARHVKAAQPDATAAELREIALDWHREFADVIGSDPSVSVDDFTRGFAAVKNPKGAVLSEIIEQAAARPLPASVHALGYGAPAALLARACAVLASKEQGGTFFLACRAAGELSGLHFTDAAAVLRRFVADGFLEQVTPGTRGHAATYRLGKAWTGSAAVQAAT